MSSRGTDIQRSEAGNHRAQAFVERANRTIGEKIFSHQYAEEAVTGGRSTRWVKRLPQILHKLNSTPTRLTGKAPLRAYAEQQVKLEPTKYNRPVGLKEKGLDPFAQSGTSWDQVKRKEVRQGEPQIRFGVGRLTISIDQ